MGSNSDEYNTGHSHQFIAYSISHEAEWQRQPIAWRKHTGFMTILSNWLDSMKSKARLDWICHQYTAVYQDARDSVSRFQTGDEDVTVAYKLNVCIKWRHDERHGVSNQRRLECLLNRLFRRLSKKTSKLRVTGIREGKSPVTGKFFTRRASNAENIFVWWRHHAHARETDWDVPTALPAKYSLCRDI